MDVNWREEGGRMTLDFPATARNRAVILEQLRENLPSSGALLEVASGSGQHAAGMAPDLPGWTWQPSDPDPRHRESIRAWTEHLPNVLAPLDLDVTGTWPDQRYDVVLAINLIHIAPSEVTGALMRGARQVSDRLYLYGALRKGGLHTAPSNAEFDRSLRAQNPDWGVRNLEDVVLEAEKVGLRLTQCVSMPANNFSLWFSALP